MNYRIVIIVVLCLGLFGCATQKTQPDNLDLPEASPADVFVNLGVKYMELGMLDVALRKLQKALQTDPGNSEAHNAIAVLYEELKQTDLARYHFKKAVQLRPTNARAQNNYGRFLCAHGDYAQAEQHFKKAYDTPLYPRPWIAMTNAGTCALMASRTQQAEDYLRQALELNPRFAPALLEMIKVSFQQRNYLSVRAFLYRYAAVAEHTPETLSIAIETERQLGDPEAADRYKQSLGNQFPTSEEAARRWKGSQ